MLPENRVRRVRADGVGDLRTSTHWMRSLMAYGGPPSAYFIVELWWPLTDTQPGKEGR